MLSSMFDPLSLAGLIVLATIVYIVAHLVYNIYFHPLRSFPGPKLWAATHILRHYNACAGRLEVNLKSLHDQYGEVVRYSPTELSFACESAWTDIYGFRKPQPLEKHAAWYNPTKLSDQSASIFSANNATHNRIRKQLLPAFSDRAMREQEPRIAGFVGLFVEKLIDCAAARQPVDIARWYNYLLFDLAGDLALGKSFNCLDGGEYHGWVANIFNSIKTGPFVRFVAQYTDARSVMRMFAPAKAKQARAAHEAYVKGAANQRLARGVLEDRRDFTSYILGESKLDGGSDKAASNIDAEEFAANCGFLILAGSEATATTLCGTTYHLLASPDALLKATAEVRAAFTSQDQIDFQSTAAKLPYVHACIAEALRIYPPAPNIFPRQTEPGQPVMVAGYAVPGGTSLGVHMLSINNHASNFHEPGAYVPERWLPECMEDASSPFFRDRRGAVQAFGIGPKGCLGKSLAWNEMRTIIAKMLFNFDLELCKESENWMHQRTYTFWEKPPLMLSLKTARKY